jgi:hypothetical protein
MISPQKFRSKTCLNCNHPLDVSDKYCSNCGQVNSNKRLSLSDFINEFLANFYAYDSKIRNTIISFIKKPGQAGLEFIQGKRQTYVNPFRFYLSISIVYFIFLSFEMKIDSFEHSSSDSFNNSKMDATLIEERKLDSLRIDSLRANAKFFTEKELAKKNAILAMFEKINTFSDFHELNKNMGIDESLDSLKFKKSKINNYLFKKAIDSNEIFGGKEDKSNMFWNYFLSQLPFILFLSLPFFTSAFSILYINKKMYYAEHMVFVFSMMSFVFFILIVEKIQSYLMNLDIGGIIFFGMVLYFYKSLRNFYQQSRLKTMLKFVLLTMILMFYTTIAFLISIGLTFLTY